MQAESSFQPILNFWFTASWDRNSPSPPEVMPRWYGMKFDATLGKSVSISKEEQVKVDQEISDLFLETLLKAGKGELNHWKEDPQGKLALVLLFDQMARNIYRKKKEAFSFATNSLEIVHSLVKEREDKKYKIFERVFLYLPLEHSEDIEDQNTSVKLFEELLEEMKTNESIKGTGEALLNYAKKHRDIVKQFGRFPHRNEVLQRETTVEEQTYLTNGGDRFGQ